MPGFADNDAAQATAWLELVDTPLLLVERGALTILAANIASRQLLGEQRFPRLPRRVEVVLGTYAARRLGDALAIAAQTSQPYRETIECLVAAGRHRLVFALAPWPGDGDRWLVTLSDADPRPSGEWRRDLVEILDLLPVGIEIYDANFDALYYNNFSDALFSYEEKAILHYEEWWEFGFPDRDEREEAKREWHQRVEAARASPDSTQSLELTVRCRDEQRRRVEFRFRFVGDKLVLLILDITNQRQLEERLRRLAEVDPLTSLSNRRSFFEAAKRAMERANANRDRLAMLMLDLDHFKDINDQHGHPAGDEVLRAISDRLRRAVRDVDLVGRLGGEEFGILLAGLTRAETADVAERLRTLVAAAPVQTASATIEATISIGAASRTPGDVVLDTLMARADHALYRAKSSGRNRVVLAEDEG